jgi:hypothetical protein
MRGTRKTPQKVEHGGSPQPIELGGQILPVARRVREREGLALPVEALVIDGALHQYVESRGDEELESRDSGELQERCRNGDWVERAKVNPQAPVDLLNVFGLRQIAAADILKLRAPG